MEELREVVLLFFHEVMGKGNLSLLPQIMHPDYEPSKFSIKQWEELALGISRSCNESNITSVVQAFQDLIGEMKFTIKQIVCQEGSVAVFWTVVGTNYRPSCRSDDLNINWETDGAHLFEFTDTKIRRLHYVADTLSAFIQARMAVILNSDNQTRTYMKALAELGLFPRV